MSGPAPRTPRVLPLLVGWGVTALVAGGIGAGVSLYLGAPGYFGGLIGLVLFGMAGLFALAARIGGR